MQNNMRKSFVFIICFMAGLSVAAQSFSLKGQLVDAGGARLPNATTLLLHAADSTMAGYALSDRDGLFAINNIARGGYILRVSYVGYALKLLPIDPPAGPILDLGKIVMEDEQKILGEVTIQGERISMFIRGDTIEYDALAFGARPNEVVEDLLKRMPGIEIDSDGTIRAQGEQVRRVLVDGREFFGRDPQMATQNLPADAISRVHVFDERSEQSRFTGIDDGERERTMNLELKEDRRQGMFGNSSLGYGPDSRFQGRSNINHFNSQGQFSVLAMGNNLNQQGFSIAEYMNFSGGVQSIVGGGGAIQMNMGGGGLPINADGRPGSNGIMTSWAGGFNMSRKLGEGSDLTGSYFYNQLDHQIEQQLERENYMPGGSYDFSQFSTQDNANYNHRLNLRLEHTISESSSVLLTFNGSLNNSNSLRFNDSQTYNFTGGLQNSSEQFNESDRQSLNMQSSLLWRQRLSRPGRTLTARLNVSADESNQFRNMEALNRFYREQLIEERILQDNLQDNISRSIGTNLTYTEPLGNKRFLELNYRLTVNRNEVNQEVFDLVDGQPVVNDLLTNIYNNDQLYHRGGLNVLVNRDVYNFTMGVYLQTTSLKGQLVSLDDVAISGQFTSILPLVRFNYDFNSFRRLSMNFETNVQEPRIQQLQPLVDNRDPLNIYVGNPDLEPSYRNRLTVRFNSFNPLSNFGFFMFASADYVLDAITNSVFMDENLIRTIMPVNTKNNLNLMGNANMNFRISPIHTRIMLGATITRMQSTNILNDATQRITNNMLSGNLRYNFSPGDQFEASLSAMLNRQLTAYEFSTLEQAYLNQTYSAELNWRFLEHYRLGGGFRYQLYEGRTSDFDRKIPMLDFSFSRRFLKNNSGELSLTGYNLMNRNLGVSQRVDTNFLEQQVTNSLGRYFLLSFTYSLNQNLNLFGGQGRGGGMRIMHAN